MYKKAKSDLPQNIGEVKEFRHPHFINIPDYNKQNTTQGAKENRSTVQKKQNMKTVEENKNEAPKNNDKEVLKVEEIIDNDENLAEKSNECNEESDDSILLMILILFLIQEKKCNKNDLMLMLLIFILTCNN